MGRITSVIVHRSGLMLTMSPTLRTPHFGLASRDTTGGPPPPTPMQAVEEGGLHQWSDMSATLVASGGRSLAEPVEAHREMLPLNPSPALNPA